MTTLRRNLKNTVNNYTDIQCKVRAATCNEPWGPAATVMTDIADATYSVVEFAEIMTILWKRLNDHGKNWRHVYKALLVLDFIIKRGSERVAQQCKEQIYSLLTLQDFRFVDKDGKDQGASVREKARQLVSLLKDEERLKSERKNALQTKERFAQNSAGIGSQNSKVPKNTGTLGNLLGRGESSRTDTRTTGATDAQSGLAPALEQARPSDRDEEDLQLELALAISKEEADKDREEDEMLRVTLERSKTETRLNLNAEPPKQTLLALSKQEAPPSLDPWGMPLETSAPTPQPPSQNDPWGSGTLLGSNSPASKPTNYTVINTTAPMTPSIANTLTESRQTPPVRPLSPAASSSMGGEDLLIPWDDPTPAGPSLSPILQPHIPNNNTNVNLLSGMNDPFDPFGPAIMSSSSTPPQIPPHAPMPSSSPNLPPASKMGTILDNRTKHLVNIDNLISTQTPTSGSTNPFGTPRASGSVFSGDSTNPFLANNTTQPALSLNELKNPLDNQDNTNPFC